MLRKLSILAPVVLAACAAPGGVTTVYSKFFTHDYYGDAASRFGPTAPVNVFGAPADGGTAQQVAASLRLPARHGGKPFEVSQDRSGLRFAIAFAPASPEALCEGRAPGGAFDPLRASIAFCDGDTALSGAVFARGDARGPNSPAFAPAAQQAINAILPLRNPHRQRRRNDP